MGVANDILKIDGVMEQWITTPLKKVANSPIKSSLCLDRA